MQFNAPLHAATIRTAKTFWITCIPLNTAAIDFAAWCFQFPVPSISTNDELPAELVSFSLDITFPALAIKH
jgi:hypothetical protein